MADVIPFRGILYNQEKIGDMSKVVAPPYDVITPGLQDALYRRHPYNIVRLILGKIEPDDRPGCDRYSRAADELRRWKDEGVLVRDERPAIYCYTQTYTVDGSKRTRKGFIALSRLEAFGKGRVYPHESTLAGPKQDRLKLMEACRANFCCIFSLYRDDRTVTSLLEEGIRESAPIIDILDDDGIENRLWRIDDPEVIKGISSAMEGRRLFIADGHHRYETALTYRNMMKEKTAGFTGREAFNYVMMYFSSMDDEGLAIMPTHRVVHSIEGFEPVSFLKRCTEYFDVDEITFEDGGEPKARERLAGLMKHKGQSLPAFGLYIRGLNAYHLLTLKSRDIMDRVSSGSMPEVFKELDVTILHSLVLSRILGLTEESQKRQENIIYIKDLSTAIDETRKGKNQLAFLLNPTRIEQVKAVAEAGYVMPQKSTYFYPKLLSGIVINSLEAEEAVVLPAEL